MYQEQTAELLSLLPKGRRLLHYEKDQYALELLKYELDRPKCVRELKKGRFATLFAKPSVREALASAGNGVLTREHLQPRWSERSLCYRITTATWGHRRSQHRWWSQTTRPGKNLVLQLNFTGAHDRAYEKLVGAQYVDPFAWTSHPVRTGKRRTMAWARLDFDLQNGEVLIEEVQNDWLREAVRTKRFVDRASSDVALRVCREELFSRTATPSSLTEYVDRVLKPHRQVWDEAVLCAAIELARGDLGVRRIFYHTHRSKQRLAMQGKHGAPRSLYETLPRKFCFSRTDEWPQFLRSERSRVRWVIEACKPSFWLLDLS